MRTVDALHLATMVFLRDHGVALSLASYDQRMLTAAAAMQIPIEAL